jgi:hypothetical protein
MSASAPTASPVKLDYKPTAVEVITHDRQYKNPFASQEPASPPAAEPAKAEPAPAPEAAEAESSRQAAPEAPAASTEPAAEKPEIQILPPAETIRPPVRWESPSVSAPRSEPQVGGRPERERPDYRPSFRPDRRDERGGEPRPEGRDFRRDQAPREPRPQFDQRPRCDQDAYAERGGPAAKAPTGFFGWLKGLFSRGKPAEAPEVREAGGEPFGEGHRHRRRHRGGRGHGGNPQGGFRGERPPQGDEQDNRGGDRYGGHRRRRHRGGRGRDRGGDPRSEGHQGGGAI